MWHIHGRWHGIYLHGMWHDTCMVNDVKPMWQVMWHIPGKWHGIYVVNDMAEKQQLFVFVDHCVVFIATLMVQMFLMHSRFVKPKNSFQKLGIFVQLLFHFQTSNFI